MDDEVEGTERRTPGRLTGADAYAFLETVCGLHSPMPGDTQVLGQFRTFLASLTPSDASLQDVFAGFEASTTAVEARVADALREIAGMAAAFERRLQLRPFGWDELCA